MNPATDDVEAPPESPPGGLTDDAGVVAAPRPRIIRTLIITLVVLALGSVLMMLVLRSYNQEKTHRSQWYHFGNATVPNRIEIFASIISVDPVQGDARVRVAFQPVGSLADDQGDLTRNINIYCNSLSGGQDHAFEAGKNMNPFEMTINLFDGQASDYPFDRFTSELEFQVSEVAKSSKAQAPHLIPLVLNVNGNVHGTNIVPGKAETRTTGYVKMDADVFRSDTVVVTAVAGMVVMWLISISVLSLTISVIFWGQKAETFTFLAGLLFALFTFRNSLPGTPPIGTLSDFLAFFWAEGIVSVSLIVMLIFSIRQADKGRGITLGKDPIEP